MMPSPDMSFPVPLIHISETNSTNSYLQALCSKQQGVAAFTTVVADFQTSGRGQRGNSWESEPKKNLLFSFVLFPDFLEARRQFLISQIVSLAIKEELDSYADDFSIKWPNDIYWKDNAKELSEQQVKKSLDNFKEIEEQLLAKDKVTKVLIGGSPYDETTQISSFLFKNKNDAILKIIDAQRSTAAKNGWGFVDFNQPMVKISLEEQKKDSTFTFCRVDRIHPDNDGQMVMAYLFLKAQGFAGKDVANMEINANKKQAVKAEGCTISNIKKIGKDISFDYLAEALPYPLDTIARGWGSKKSQAEVIKEVPFMEEMNRETLKVTGLKGNYKLLIDDEEIGTWSGDELAKGINLAAESKTPQYQQALTVMHLNEYRWEIERTFREYAWCEFGFFQQKGLLYADDRKAIEVMDENLDKNVWLKGRRDMYSKMMFEAVRDARQQEMDVLINKIYEINKPVVRKILLRKI